MTSLCCLVNEQYFARDGINELQLPFKTPRRIGGSIYVKIETVMCQLLLIVFLLSLSLSLLVYNH